jgi:hypothetical protein
LSRRKSRDCDPRGRSNSWPQPVSYGQDSQTLLIDNATMKLLTVNCRASSGVAPKPTRLRSVSYGAVASPFIPAPSCRVSWRRRIKTAKKPFSRLGFQLFYRFWDCMILSFGLPTWQLFLSHVEMPSLGRIYACSKSHTTSTIRIHQPPINPPRCLVTPQNNAQLTAGSLSLLRKIRLKRKRNPMKIRYSSPCPTNHMKRRTSACTYRFHHKKGRPVSYPRQTEKPVARIRFHIYYT